MGHELNGRRIKRPYQWDNVSPIAELACVVPVMESKTLFTAETDEEDEEAETRVTRVEDDDEDERALGAT